MRSITGRCALFCLALAFAGCGGEGGSGGATASIPECGFSMTLPPGWATESHVGNEFFLKGDRDNNWGVAKLPLAQGQRRKAGSFKDYVAWTVETDRFDGTLAELISQRPLTLGPAGAAAHEVVFKTRDGAYAFNLFAEMDDWGTLQVLFVVSERHYQRFREAFPAVVDSIRLARKQVVYD